MCPPSKVICRACMDLIGAKLEAWAGRPEPTEPPAPSPNLVVSCEHGPNISTCREPHPWLDGSAPSLEDDVRALLDAWDNWDGDDWHVFGASIEALRARLGAGGGSP